MGVKVNQRNRSVYSAAGSQLGKGYTVIPSYGNGNDSMGKQFLDLFLNDLKRFLDITGY